MAEGAVAAQQRLLEKERKLRQKEEQISLLLDQAKELRTQRLGLSTRATGGSQRKGDSIHDRSSVMERSPRKSDSIHDRSNVMERSPQKSDSIHDRSSVMERSPRKSDSIHDRSNVTERSPRKSDNVTTRNRRDSLEQEEPTGVGELPEELMVNPPSSLTATSIAEVLSAHPAQGVESVASEVSEDIKSGPNKGFGEYSHDTFESITTAAGVLTSTPYSMRRDQQATRDDVSSPRRISESPTGEEKCPRWCLSDKGEGCFGPVTHVTVLRHVTVL